MSENGAKNCDPTTNDAKNDVEEKNNKTNTLKNVKRKIRKNLTFRKKEKPQVIVDEKSDKLENNSDEEKEKGKFTLKKIFRKSSFRKIISNLQQFTNFTVSIVTHTHTSPIHSLRSDT
jgi:hypothetical protein